MQFLNVFDKMTGTAPPDLTKRHELIKFGLSDMIECGKFVRGSGRDALSMQGAAQVLVQYFYNAFGSQDSGVSDCALIRCFKTHCRSALPSGLQAALNGHSAIRSSSLDSRCLTLLATAGDLPAWNDPTQSSSHRVIPLESAESVMQAPMIAQLIQQLGLEIEAILSPNEELLLEADERTYGVFHIETALGSPSIPAQHFVQQHGIQSVLGFGGLLPSGDLFAVILFSKVRISRDVAYLFRTLALSVKLVFLPFTWGPVFAEDPEPVHATTRSLDQDQTRSEIATLRLLTPALEAAALYQTKRLQDVIADLSMQKAELHRLGSRLSSTLESTTDAVLMLDPEWKLTYLNQHARSFLASNTDPLGQSLWNTLPPTQTAHWQLCRKTMDERLAVQFQEHYPAPIDKWFEVHAFPSDDGIAVFLQDVTERRKAESALMQSEKLAAVGRLAASIAHEINNPLESVTNLLYLARTSTELSEVQDYLATAERELRRVGAITNQTLRFHKQSTNPTEVTCKELLDGVLSIYHGRIVNSRVREQLLLRSNGPLLCFEGEIRQVLNNLVGNAIDAMHPEGGRLLLRSRNATDWSTGRKGVTITVADTGPGMSPQTLMKAATPFFTTKGIGGTGLGLWISREISDRHAGRLTIRSSQMDGHTGTVIILFMPEMAVHR